MLSADLATVVPTTANGGIADGGKTITIHIHHGVHFSPPVNREVTSADVAYAIERAANPNVASAYFQSYFGAGASAPLVGATSASYKGGPIPGIQTPDKYTLVFHTVKPSGAFLVSALSLSISAPVPESFAGPLDKQSPTTYGSKYLVASGPYMIQSDPKTGQFQGIGYQTGKSLTLVRNPNWNAKTDWRPAYLDRINFVIGGDSTVIGRQVLQGSDAVQFDTPAQSMVKLAYQQLSVADHVHPGLRRPLRRTQQPGRAVQGRQPPPGGVGQPRSRRDRQAARRLAHRTAGTHFIYPGVDGYHQSGGAAGPQVPWNVDVNGSLSVAQKYMKAAGYSSGKYTGSATVQVVGANNGNSPAIVQLVNTDLTQLGFHTHVSLVDQSVMYAKYCGVPKQEIDVCPSAAGSVTSPIR